MQSRVIYSGKAAFAPYIGNLKAILFESFSNPKTGKIIALAMLPADEAGVLLNANFRAQGLDRVVCGVCPFRSQADGGEGGCYVSGTAVMGYRGAALAAERRGATGLPEVWPVDKAGKPYGLRLGAYGDPAAVPEAALMPLIQMAKSAGANVFGYTHAWKKREAAWLQAFCMASTEDAAGQAKAIAAGWRTYRIVEDTAAGDASGLTQCESAAGIACADCGKCTGTTGHADAGRYIVVHGPSVKKGTQVLARRK